MHELLSKLISNQKYTLEIYVAKSFALSGVYIEFCKGLKNCYVFAWGYFFLRLIKIYLFSFFLMAHIRYNIQLKTMDHCVVLLLKNCMVKDNGRYKKFVQQIKYQL